MVIAILMWQLPLWYGTDMSDRLKAAIAVTAIELSGISIWHKLDAPTLPIL